MVMSANLSDAQSLRHNILATNAQTLRGKEGVALLSLRLGTLTVLLAVLTLHLRSLRVFRWEQSVSGGVIITYCVALLGLVLCAGVDKCGAKAFQVYLTGVGAVLLAVNAGAIWSQWRRPSDLTHVVVELLHALGVPVRRQILMKASLSAAAALALLADLTIILIMSHS